VSVPRILHLGLGNFHRAHQAWFTHHANRLSGTGWRITGVAMSRPDLRDALASTGGAYTLAERGLDGLSCTRIALHDRLRLAAEDPAAVIAEIGDPQTHIVTLTVTEKGYYLAPDGSLDLDAPAIRADLDRALPQSAIGLLAHGIQRRKGRPLTVISCDNLPENGDRLRDAVQAYAASAGLTLGPREDVTFPNSMVDRITPATTASLQAEIATITGADEPAPVLTERFCEWVIEDRFAGPRPDWDKAGAILAADVRPFEARKLRCLNAAHSALAYGGLLRGHRYVHEAYADPHLRRLLEALWREAAPGLPPPVQRDLPRYLGELDARFAVPEMQHRLDQIAMDGSLKLPVRIGPLLTMSPETPSSAALQTLGAWLAYLIAHGLRGQSARDSGAEPFLALARNAPLDRLAEAAYAHVSGADPSQTARAALCESVRTWLA